MAESLHTCVVRPQGLRASWLGGTSEPVASLISYFTGEVAEALRVWPKVSHGPTVPRNTGLACFFGSLPLPAPPPF